MRRLGLGRARGICIFPSSCSRDTTVFVAKRILVSKKKRGPPPTGKGTPIVTRLQPTHLAALDGWIAKQHEPLSRPEAIRRLIEMGLKSKLRLPLHTKKTAAKAAEIAERHIDPLIELSATVEERRRRKRRLIKGPTEFRDIRADLPKPIK